MNDHIWDIIALRERIAELDAERERLRRANIVAILRASAAQCERHMRITSTPVEGRFFSPVRERAR